MGNLVCENFGVQSPTGPFCDCVDHWSGMACSMCSADEACTVGEDTVCDKSMIIGAGKQFECFVKDADYVELIGDRVTVHCESASECSFSAWGMQQDGYGDTVYYETLYCAIHNVSSSYDWAKRDLKSTSVSSECVCVEGSDRCEDEYVAGMIERIRGTASITCNLIEGSCVLDPSDFPGTIPLTCYGGGCLSAELPFPENQNATKEVVVLSWQGMAVDSLLVLLVILFVFSFFSCIVLECLCCMKLHIEDRGKQLEREQFEITITLAGGGYTGNRPGSCLTQLWVWVVSCCCKDTTFADRRGTKTVLGDMSLTISNGITGVLGNTGSGKTTLLNILGDSLMRGKMGKGSSLLVNGVSPRKVAYRRLLAMAVNPGHPMDPHLSVEEYVHTAASLRNYMARREVAKDVDKVIRQLGLGDIRNNIVGSTEETCISQGERKRTTIAAQLASRPNVLIADEVLEDMDGKHMRKVFGAIKKWMPPHKTTIVTLHNPPDDVFSGLKHVVVVESGKVVLHTSAADVIAYVDAYNRSLGSRNGFAMELRKKNHRRRDEEEEEEDGESGMMDSVIEPKDDDEGPSSSSASDDHCAEERLLHMSDDDDLDAVGPVSYAEGARMFHEEIRKRNDYRTIRTTDSGIMLRNEPAKSVTWNAMPYSSSILKQTRLLLYREVKDVLNSPFVIVAQLLVTVTLAKIIGLVYSGLGNNIKANQNRMGFIFLACHLLGQVGSETLSLFAKKRVKIAHELQTGFYDPTVYFAVSVASDFLKYRVWVPVLFSTITYWEVGFQDGRFAFFLTVMLLTSMISNLVCVLVGCVVAEKAAMRVYGLVFLFNMLTSGLLANVWSIPPWLQWLGHLGFWKHAYEALMINEFTGLAIVLDPDGVPPLPTSGDYWLTQIGMYANNRDFDVLMLVLYVIIYFFLAMWAFRLYVRVRK